MNIGMRIIEKRDLAIANGVIPNKIIMGQKALDEIGSFLSYRNMGYKTELEPIFGMEIELSNDFDKLEVV